jgi:glucosamine--fructose-6-phosphate aminotransferase (isomerizing)
VPDRLPAVDDGGHYAAAITDILSAFGAAERRLESVFNPAAESIFARTNAVHFTANGRSHHAGVIACSFIERFCRIPARIEAASGYPFRRPIVGPGTLFVAIAASGERRESLAALRVAKASGYIATMAVTSVHDSSLLREADMVLSAGGDPASRNESQTSFICQLVAVGQLTAMLARQLRPGTCLAQILQNQLGQLAELARDVATLDGVIAAAGRGFQGKDHAYYVGQEGSLHPIARDGALQFKRVSHLHAEALSASEMKYGSLSLVDENTPVVALVPNDEQHESLMETLCAVRARRGRLYLFADSSVNLAGFDAATIIRMPRPITWCGWGLKTA